MGRPAGWLALFHVDPLAHLDLDRLHVFQPAVMVGDESALVRLVDGDAQAPLAEALGQRIP